MPKASNKARDTVGTGSVLLRPPQENVKAAVSDSTRSVTITPKDWEEKIDKKIGEGVDSKIRGYTESLAVFVALFTFVSVNIQIFSRISFFNDALVFVMLEFLCLAGFVIILDLILKEKKLWGYLIIIIVAMVIPLVFCLLPKVPFSIEENASNIKLDSRVDMLEKRIDELILRETRRK